MLIGLMAGGGGEGEDCGGYARRLWRLVEVMRGEKARVWSAPFGSDKNGRFWLFLGLEGPLLVLVA